MVRKLKIIISLNSFSNPVVQSDKDLVSITIMILPCKSKRFIIIIMVMIIILSYYSIIIITNIILII